MKGKLIIQFVAGILLFSGCYFGLSQVNWMDVFKVSQLSQDTEEKLGDLLWEFAQHNEEIISDTEVIAPVDSILAHLCASNGIAVSGIKLHMAKNDLVNAYALPNGHLVVYSGLILACENESELAGVLAHELSHIQLLHVRKKLVKELGLSAIISATSGGAAGELAAKALKSLTSSAYDRSLEKEADIQGVRYLLAANIDPESFAGFLSRLSDSEPDMQKYFTWVSTHPHPRERAEYIKEYVGNKKATKTAVLNNQTWLNLKTALKHE